MTMPGWLIAVVAAVGVWLLLLFGLIVFGRRSAARELAVLIPNLLLLFRGLLRDQRVSRPAKVALALSIVWIASPIDLIPEFIPVAGPLDDAIVAALALRLVLRSGGPQVIAEHWRGSDDSLRVLLRLAGAPPRS